MNNNRGIKNTLLILIMILAIISIIFTGYLAKKNIVVETTTEELNNNMKEQPNGTPPEKEEDNNKTSSMNSDALDPNEEIPNGEEPPDIPTNNENTNIVSNKLELTTPYYIAFGIEAAIFSLALMYLILSKGNKKTFIETFIDKDKLVICLLSTILLVTGITYGSSKIVNSLLEDSNKITTSNNNTSNSINNNNYDNNKPPEKREDNSNTSSTSKGKVTVTKEETLSETYETNEVDESPILVNNGGKAIIENATINKNGGDSSNIESSEFNGVNAGILVENSSTATIKNSKITTNAKGSNAVFATGKNSKIYISNSEITTSSERSSRGLDATYGGYIEGEKLTITTNGDSCATLATDRGEGTIKVKDSELTTNGAGSPVIYSTGNISLDNSLGVANNSQMVVIEGKNSATVTNSTLNATGVGNRNNVDKSGIMIYQSMSGDASVGKGIFTASDSSLTIDKSSSVYLTAPMFFVTNTNAEINLSNNKLSYGSNILLSIAGTSEWGNTNSNGGNVILNANNQSLTGNITVDNISTLEMNLTKSSYRGTINKNNVGKNIKLKLDKDSMITLTGDSYVSSLENEDTKNSNIDFDIYKLYVNGVPINK